MRHGQSRTKRQNGHGRLVKAAGIVPEKDPYPSEIQPICSDRRSGLGHSAEHAAAGS
jgi:hypothetical protein